MNRIEYQVRPDTRPLAGPSSELLQVYCRGVFRSQVVVVMTFVPELPDSIDLEMILFQCRGRGQAQSSVLV